MSLDNIILSPSLIRDLFRDNLVAVPQPPKSKMANGIAWLGNNEKNVAVLITNVNAAFLGDDELDLLTRMLGACKLTLSDVAIINIAREKELDHKSLNTHFKSQKALLFGVEPIAINLPFQIPHFQVQNFNDAQYLSSPDLTALLPDKDLRGKLWTGLQKMFI